MCRRALLMLLACVACAGLEKPAGPAADPASLEEGAGWVTVRVDPAPPDTTLRIGAEAMALPPEGELRVALPQGLHAVAAFAPGFRTARAAVEVESGQEHALELTLEPESADYGATGDAEESERSMPERVARGAAGEVGKRSKSRAVREYRSVIDRALDYLVNGIRNP